MIDTLQTGKTRWSRYQIAYHFVCIPKYRRRILTGEVEKVTKQAIVECCKTHGFEVLALETDEDHVHCCVSAPPKDAPSKIVWLLKGYSSKMVRKSFPALAKKPVGHNCGPVLTTWVQMDKSAQKRSVGTSQTAKASEPHQPLR